MFRSSLFLLAMLTLFAVMAPAQTDEPQTPTTGASSPKKKPAPAPPQDQDTNDILNAPMTPPRSDSKPDSSSEPAAGSYSSSKDSTGDLTPPAGDAKDHPGGDVKIEPGPGVPDDVMETKPWNPHEADKDVEVGLFYFKRGNLKAAEARFRDALKWQDNHAEALYRLAVVLEKEGQMTQARQNYEAYLKILPKGEFAADSKKALERLGEKKTAKK